LYFDPRRRLCFIDNPSGNSLPVGAIKHSLQMPIRNGKIKAHGHRRDQQGFGHGH